MSPMAVYRREYSRHRHTLRTKRHLISSFMVLLGGCIIMSSQREYIRQYLNREDVDMARTVNHRGMRAESKRNHGEIGRSYRTYAYLRLRFRDRTVDAVSHSLCLSCHARTKEKGKACRTISRNGNCFGRIRRMEAIASVLGYLFLFQVLV